MTSPKSRDLHKVDPGKVKQVQNISRRVSDHRTPAGIFYKAPEAIEERPWFYLSDLSPLNICALYWDFFRDYLCPLTLST